MTQQDQNHQGQTIETDRFILKPAGYRNDVPMADGSKARFLYFSMWDSKTDDQLVDIVNGVQVPVILQSMPIITAESPNKPGLFVPTKQKLKLVE